jgi:hypothetical protein
MWHGLWMFFGYWKIHVLKQFPESVRRPYMKRMTRIFFLVGCLWLLSMSSAEATISGIIDAVERKAFDNQPPWGQSLPYLHHARFTSKERADRTVSFEAVRMLSTGMTKVEVLSRVGSPHHSFRKSRVWVYSTTDNWIVQLNFVGERVIGINWSRP